MRVFVFCADPREEADLEPKINQKLRKPGEKIIRLSVFGGPICLAYSRELKKDCDFLLRQLRFANKTFGIKEIVLVGHDCGYYKCIPMHADEEKKKPTL